MCRYNACNTNTVSAEEGLTRQELLDTRKVYYVRDYELEEAFTEALTTRERWRPMECQPNTMLSPSTNST